ncbi:MAG: Methyltransferase type 11 [Thermomicrobiales bacterium]|nr:Methyltransferase type 11 [Thermomicrobiales bacterium]MDF3015267.1 Methyltransferase type 11 [Thermomicrobiales bacterium]
MTERSGADFKDPYADLPDLYDLEHAEFSDDVELYLRLAEVVGDPVLELGCGTGRVLLPLAAAGHRITGIDRSQPMLDRARALLQTHAGTLSRRVTLFEGSLTEAECAPGGPFGLVIFSLNGLMHLSTMDGQRAALASARRALDPRGMLVIDVLNPTPEMLITFDGRVQHEGSWREPDGTVIDRFSARTHDAAEQRIDTELWYDLTDREGHIRRVRSGFPMRYLVASELTLLLEVSGFVEWKRYGSYDLDPFDDRSDRLIVTAEVTPS